jgi:uncharacterized cupredoxin-like copper-binding protein
MKKSLSILLLGALPLLALASGNHKDSHETAGGHSDAHHASGPGHQHDMKHDDHEADAGRPGNPARVSRVIEVNMDDSMRFTPSQLNFKAGETVRFFLHNKVKIRHEMVIGSMDELKEHMQMMRNNPAMQHADANMISLAPGEHGEMIWQFDKPGTFDFACLVPGHMEAGMTGKFRIE